MPGPNADSRPAVLRIKPIEHLLAPGLILLFALWIFRQQLFQGEAIFLQVFRDPNPILGSHFWYQYQFQSLAQGDFPLWNPWRGMGFPQLANYQSAFFSPLLAPLFLIPLRLIAVPYLLLRLALAGWGAYLYARHLSLRHWPAVLTALAFGLSGWMIQYVNNQHLVIDLLLPFLLLSLDRLFLVRRGREFLLFGLVVVLILLGGQPSSALFTLGLGLGYALWRRVRSGREVVVVGTALALAGLGALAQILPFLEFIPQAWTYHPPGAWTQRIPLATAITLLAPGFFGFTGDQHLPVMMLLPYLGAIPLALALAALRHFRRLAAPAGFFLATALLSFGFIHGLPLFSQLMSLPVLDRLTYVKYCQPLFTWAVAVLAGMAADQLRPRELKSGFILALVFLVSAGLFHFHWLTAARAVRLFSGAWAAAVLIGGWLLIRRPAGAGLAVSAALGLLGDAQFNTPLRFPWLESRQLSFLSRFSSPPPDFPRLAAGAEIAPIASPRQQVDDLRISDAIFVGRMMRYLNLLNGHTPKQGLEYTISHNYTRVVPDPARFHGPLAHLARVRWFLSREPLPPNSTIAALLAGSRGLARGPDYLAESAFDLRGDFRRVFFQHPPSRMELPAELTARHSGLKFGLAVDPRQWSQPGDGVWFQVLAGGQVLFCRHLNPSQRDSDRRWVEAELNFAAGKSVILVTLPGPSGDYDWSGWGDLRWREEPVFSGRLKDGIRVYENEGAFPLARLVGNWQGTRDMEESEKALRSGRDLSRWAVVEGVSASSEGNPAAPGRVRVLERKDSFLGLEVDAEQESLLLVTDNYFPGWQAKVNGRPVRIYPADLTFRGIFVPAGRAHIEMIYRPWAFRVGLWAALCTWLTALSAAGFRRDRRRGA